MQLTLSMVLIVGIGTFIGSFIDAIAGGGGVICVPVFFLTGLPSHIALGTNKLASTFGTTTSAIRYIRHGFVDWKLGVPAIIFALVGSYFGTSLQLRLDEAFLQYMLLIVLPIIAVVVLRQREFSETMGELDFAKRAAIVCSAAFVIGGYDGFYGPGSGTFLMLVFCTLAKLDVRTAQGSVKIVNLASNVGALATAIMHGKVFWALGLIGAATSVFGHWLGSGLAIKNGSKIVRPAVILVLLLLLIKVVSDLLAG